MLDQFHSGYYEVLKTVLFRDVFGKMDSYLLHQDQSRGCSFALSLQLHAAFELGLSLNEQD